MSATTSFASAWAEAQESDEVRQAVRLVPAGEAVGDQDAAAARIREHLTRYGLTPGALARALDIKVGVVGMLLADANKIPAGPRATLLGGAEKWCAADAHERELRQARFIATPVTRLVGGIARVVRETETVGLVLGGAGLGKSFALDAVCAELPRRTIVARVAPDGRGATGILRVIGTAASAASCSTIRGSAGLLVIDEAHLGSVLGLEAARAVFDRGGTGLLLVGTSALRRTLNPAADPLVGPLCSRVALRVDLDAELLAPGRDGRPHWIDAATVKAIIERHVAQPIDASGMARLTEAANFRAGHLRTAVNAAKVARVLAHLPAAAQGQRPTAADEQTLTISGAHVAAALRMGGVTENGVC